MILPSKHLPVERTLLAAGAAILSALHEPGAVSVSWEAVRHHPALTTFDRFLLALDFLFVLGLIAFERGRLVRVTT